jgi:hypothetical protein
MKPTAICIFNNIHKENALLLSLRLEIPILKELKENEIILILGSVCGIYKLLHFQMNYNVKYIIYQAENIHTPYFQDKQYRYLLKRNIVYNYSQHTADYIDLHYGIKSAGLFEWEFLKRDNIHYECDNPIDLLFYGYPNDERESVEKLLKEKYPTKNIVFAYKVYEKELVDLLIRSKYVLNIPYFEKSALETHRINQALYAGCKVYSKKSCCNYLNEKYKKKIKFIQNWSDIVL